MNLVQFESAIHSVSQSASQPVSQKPISLFLAIYHLLLKPKAKDSFYLGSIQRQKKNTTSSKNIVFFLISNFFLLQINQSINWFTFVFFFLVDKDKMMICKKKQSNCFLQTEKINNCVSVFQCACMCVLRLISFFSFSDKINWLIIRYQFGFINELIDLWSIKKNFLNIDQVWWLIDLNPIVWCILFCVFVSLCTCVRVYPYYHR